MKILVLPGDHIGIEIMESAKKVLSCIEQKFDVVVEIEEEVFGGASIEKYGVPLTDDVLEKAKQSDAILLGAIGGPEWDSCKQRPEEGLLKLRKSLHLYANIRPVKMIQDLVHLSPLKNEVVQGTDIIVVRELTGGAYFGTHSLSSEEASDDMRYTRVEIERIMHKAFQIANQRSKKLCSVDKANVLASSKLWRKIAIEIGEYYKEVELTHMYVDAAAMALVTHPSTFDVLVTENLFGDILSDESSVIAGSIGMLSSSSHSLEGPSLYEPSHGSAPDISGKNLANPIGMLYSVASMFRESFQREDIACSIEAAIIQTIANKKLTKDLEKENFVTTEEFTEYVCQYIM